MIPVAAVIGPVGVGKTRVLREADSLLVEATIRHATVEIEELARFWQAPNGKGDLAYRNLAALWANYRAAGADRLLLGLLAAEREDLSPVYSAVPGAKITVVRLKAPLRLIEERVRSRESSDAEAELSAARWWASRLERTQLADIVVDNSKRPAREVASQMLQALGWIPNR